MPKGKVWRGAYGKRRPLRFSPLLVCWVACRARAFARLSHLLRRSTAATTSRAQTPRRSGRAVAGLSSRRIEAPASATILLSGNAIQPRASCSGFTRTSRFACGDVWTGLGTERHFWNVRGSGEDSEWIDLSWKKFPTGSVVQQYRVLDCRSLGDRPETVERCALLLSRVLAQPDAHRKRLARLTQLDSISSRRADARASTRRCRVGSERFGTGANTRENFGRRAIRRTRIEGRRWRMRTRARRPSFAAAAGEGLPPAAWSHRGGTSSLPSYSPPISNEVSGTSPGPERKGVKPPRRRRGLSEAAPPYPVVALRPVRRPSSAAAGGEGARPPQRWVRSGGGNGSLPSYFPRFAHAVLNSLMVSSVRGFHNILRKIPRGHGENVRAALQSLVHVHQMTNRADDDLAVELLAVEDVARLLDDGLHVVAHIAHAAREQADVGRAGERCQISLVERHQAGDVGVHAARARGCAARACRSR